MTKPFPLARWALPVLAAAALAACGGSDEPRYTSMVNFGDSLSDVGSYRVGSVAALGGGKFTVNGPNGLNWTEHLAQRLEVAAPCAAQTGLLPNVPGLVGAPVTSVSGCQNYAQGGARVTSPVGPHSVALQNAPFFRATIGMTATPVQTQITTHLSRTGGRFSGTELVTVMAGANDLFMNLNAVAAAAQGGNAAVGAALAAGWSEAAQTAVAAGGAGAVDAAAAAAVQNMAQAGATLATLVRQQVLAKGAGQVLVANVPDVGNTPLALERDAATRQLITTLAVTFNTQLQTGLQSASVVWADVFARGREQVAAPARFGLTNLTGMACSTDVALNPLGGSSLACTQRSTTAADTDGYLYADDVHPTPRGNRLIADYVIERLDSAGAL